MKNYIYFPISLIGSLFLFIPTTFWANDFSTVLKESLFTTLATKKMNQVKITLDINRFISEKLNAKEKQQKVAIQFRNDAGETIDMKVKISARGIYRRQFCDFPPMRLNFSKGRLRMKGFIGKFDKYKLVTHCIKSKKINQALLKEFAVYKMYNQLTPESFKVHFLKITYQDSKDEHFKINQIAFLIEENDEMAARLGGTLVEKLNLPPQAFTKKSYHNSLLFNYMIGNLDARIQVQKNLKYIQVQKNQPLILVPYDFDYCGLVAPTYITLNPNYQQKSLKERFPTGQFADKTSLWETVEKFQKVKTDFLKCYNSMDLLKRSEKRKINKFLTSFYDVLEDEERLEKVFLGEE